MADVKKRQFGGVVVDDVRVRLAGASTVDPISPAVIVEPRHFPLQKDPNNLCTGISF